MVCFVFMGCSSSEKQDPEITTSEVMTVTPAADLHEDFAFTTEYDWLYAQAADIDIYYVEIGARAAKLLETAIPKNALENQQFSNVALIAAMAFYFADNPVSGSDYATRAYQYRDDQILTMHPQWNNKRWIEMKGVASTKKMMLAKDTIIGLRNSGADFFQKGNVAYLAKGDFANGLDAYQNALSRGLASNTDRLQCYIRLAGCLYKAGREEEAEEIFLNAWLHDPDMKLQGDRDTQNFLNSLKLKYQGK